MRDREAALSRRELERRGLVARLRRVSVVFRRKPARPEALERDLETAEEIFHNIESCIIQLEGRLLTL